MRGELLLPFFADHLAFLLLLLLALTGDPAAGHAGQRAGQHPECEISRQGCREVLLTIGGKLAVGHPVEMFESVIGRPHFRPHRAEAREQPNARTEQSTLERAAAGQAGRH